MPQPELTPEGLIETTGVTKETLETGPGRVVKFVGAYVSTPAIRAQLRPRGLNPNVLKIALDALSIACQLPEKESTLVTHDAVRTAYNYLDNIDEEVFRIIKAAWQYNFPVQYAFATAGIGPAEGIMSTVHLGTLFGRWDELADGESRVATREQDHAALACVVERGLSPLMTDPIRAHLKIIDELEPEVEAIDETQFELRRIQALIALRIWFLEWSEIARVAIKRRDHLISLGLVSRRPRRSGGEPGDEGGMGGPTD